MFKVDKKDEPNFFKEYKKRNNLNSWENFDYNIKRKLKEYMFENEQGYNCPYCESIINLDNSQIEHVMPKDKFPRALSEYSNYLVGCVNRKTCGQYKGSKWNENFINPTLEDPKEYLTYDLMTGKIIPVEKEGIKYDKARITIELLNLNEKRLCEMRKTFILENRYSIKYLDYYQEFPTLRDWLKENYKWRINE